MASWIMAFPFLGKVGEGIEKGQRKKLGIGITAMLGFEFDLWVQDLSSKTLYSY